MTRRRRPAVQRTAVVTSLVLCLAPSLVLGYGQGTNLKNKILMYDIQKYAQQLDKGTGQSVDWKPAIAVTNTNMQAVTLYNAFDCSDTNFCGSNTSVRNVDSQVNVINMNWANGNWSLGAGNFTFFYGHNISPDVYDALSEAFPAWFPAGTVVDGQSWGPINGTWQQTNLCSGMPGQTSGCKRDIFKWGSTISTPSTPFYYHWTNSQRCQFGIMDTYFGGSRNYSVFYGYNPLTSVLMGKDWTSSSW